MRILRLSLAALFLLTSFSFATEVEVRVKDIYRIDGLRENQLIGYGLIVGLDGTGDSKKTLFTNASVVNMLERLGVTVDSEKMGVKNVAAVMVTAELGPFAREGDRIDVTVSSLGDAKTIEGGILLQTPLLAANKEVFAVAQGPISIGGSNEALLSGQTENFPTVARMPGGAIIEKTLTSSLLKNGMISLILDRADFTNASRLVKAINSKFGDSTALATDASLVNIAVPRNYKNDLVGFVAELEMVTLTPDSLPKVVINERTGTIVIGENVRISQVAISHGNLSLTVRAVEKISGEKTEVEKRERNIILQGSVAVSDIVIALNKIGATPRDITAIFQAIKAANALHAQLVLM